MNLNKAQAEAVEYFDGSLLVLAGPGTGKTQLLSAKVAHILQNTDTNPENILCITFTESGAANMRERLLSILGPTANKINIFTYHSFGSFLISQYKNYSVSLKRNFDQPIDPVMQYKIVEEIKQGLEPFDIMRMTATKDLIDTIASLKSARLKSEDLRQIYEDNEAQITEINQNVGEILAQIVPRMKFELALPIYQEVLAEFLQIGKKFYERKGIKPLGEVLAYNLRTVFNGLNAEKPSISPLTAWKNKTFDKDKDDRIKLHIEVAQFKLKSLVDFLAKYEQKLTDNGWFDFADMIEEAISAIKQDDGFKMTLAERFQFVLLDEFQDTNPSQFELVKLITDYEKPQIMAVGDDDQAIFEFQGANASNLETFRRYYDAHVVTLTENYRSAAPVLALSRGVAEQIADRFATQNNYEKVLQSFLTKNLQPQCVIERHEFQTASLEYNWVAEQVEKLVDLGIAPEEIAIIAPKHKNIAPILSFFQDKKIPISYERRDNLFLDELISNVVDLARIAKNISDGNKWERPILQILAMECFAVEPSEAIEFVMKARKNSENVVVQMVDSDNQAIKLVGELLAKLATMTESRLEDFLQVLVGDKEYDGQSCSPLKNFYTADGQDEVKKFNFYEKLLVLLENVKKYSKNLTPKLIDLLNFVDDYNLAGQALMNTSPYKNSDKAVQILSAHKSKGLEFKYVFLIAVDDDSWGNAGGNNNLLVLPANLAQIRRTGVTEDERLRLFFVAVTRAKTHLYMTNARADFAGKVTNRLEYLHEVMRVNENGETEIYSPWVDGAKVIQHEVGEVNDVLVDSLMKAWSGKYDSSETKIRNILLHKMKNYKISASDLTTFLDIVYAGPAVFYEQKVLPNIETAATDSQFYGIAMHKVLERVVNEKIDDAQAERFYRESLADFGLNAEDRTYLLEKGLKSLEIVLAEWGEVLRGERGRAEVSFMDERLEYKGALLSGRLDFIEVDEVRKTIEVYDFKTGKFREENWKSHPTTFMYMVQLIFYKMLLNLSPKYRNYKVLRGHILFITPDNEMKIHQKSYEFEEEDEEMVRNLVVKVYNFATKLNFLDETEIYLPPDKSRNMRQIREFIAKILDF